MKECLEDYYVLKYIKEFNEGTPIRAENEGNSIRAENEGNSIRADELMPLIQMFPQSTVFYIVYGMCVKENKMKISAFLKCIQLNRESPISVDLLASLYLKEKDYLTACKLFLKSL